MNANRGKRTTTSRILTYHEVGPIESRYLYGVSNEQFAEHIHRVAELNSFGTSTGKEALITFDDGHITQYQNALPVLERCSTKAIFFVTAGWTESRNGYMTWKQLLELSALGHEVQGHGWSHSNLTLCSDSDLEMEVTRSKLDLEDHLGKEVDAMSMPGGRWDERVLKACARAGYKHVFSSDPWRVSEEKLRLTVSGRWMVTRQMDAAQVSVLLEGKGFGLQALHAKHLMKETVKKIVGDNLYQSLWRSLAHKKESIESTDEKRTPVNSQN